MSASQSRTFALSETYAFLEDGGAAPLVPTGGGFWKDLMSGNPTSPDALRVARGDGWLVALYRITADNAAWEMHPAGDELLAMLTGEMDVVLEQASGDTAVTLRPGGACVVPKGTWHRQVVRQAGEYIGATYGKGTQHRPR